MWFIAVVVAVVVVVVVVVFVIDCCSCSSCNNTVSKKLWQQCYFLNNSVKHWPILIIFGTQHREEN